MPSPFASGKPAARAMRASTRRTTSSCFFARNVPALVRMPLLTGPFVPTTVLGASCFFASAFKCSHSSAVRKLRNKYALGCSLVSTTGGVRGNPGKSRIASSKPYVDLGNGAADAKNADSFAVEETPPGSSLSVETRMCPTRGSARGA